MANNRPVFPRGAAVDRLKRFFDASVAHEYFNSLNEDDRHHYLSRASRVMKHPERICPHCMYDFSGTVRDVEIAPCSECGREISAFATALVWYHNALWARRYKYLTFLGVPSALVLAIGLGWLVVALHDSYFIVQSIGMVVGYAALFIVPLSMLTAPIWAWRWRRLASPRGSAAIAATISALALVLNIVFFVCFFAVLGVAL